MPFKDGQSGNPAGRPAGVPNKVNMKVKEMITSLLEDNYEDVQAAFKALPNKLKVRAWIDLLSYAVPKLQSISGTFDYDQLTDEQLDYIIEGLKRQDR